MAVVAFISVESFIRDDCMEALLDLSSCFRDALSRPILSLRTVADLNAFGVVAGERFFIFLRGAPSLLSNFLVDVKKLRPVALAIVTLAPPGEFCPGRCFKGISIADE